MHLLIAEDDPTTRMLLSGVVSGWGYQPTAVGDGQAALEQLEAPDGPRLALVDWQMPRLDGVELCRRLRAGGSSVYVVLLTGRDAKEDVVEGLDAGADDYVSKPFNAEELRVRLAAGRRIIELQASLRARIAELEEARARIKTLHGILPICMHCKKIRTDDASWERIESYIEAHTDADFSHGLCPECLERYYGESLLDGLEEGGA